MNALRITHQMLADWKRDEILVPVVLYSGYNYPPARINRFLTAMLVSPKAKAPTIEAILAGDKLLKLREAAAELGIGYDATAHAVRNGDVVGIKLNTQTRVLSSSVTTYKKLLRRKTVTVEVLAKLFGITPTSLLGWKDGPKRTILLGQTCFTEGDVNDFLVNCEHTLAKAPTLNDLLDGTSELLTPEEASKASGVPATTLTSQPYVQRIHLSTRRVRIVASSLTDLPPADLQKTYSTEQACQVLNVSYTQVMRWIKSGELPSTLSEDRIHQIPHDGLVAFIRPRIRHDDDPEAWIIDRLSPSPEPLLSLSEAAAILGSKKRVLAIAAALFYIKSGATSNFWFFTKASVLSYYENDETVTGETIGNLCDVVPQAVYAWYSRGILVCHAHDHTESPWRIACALLFLANALRHTDPDEWFKAYNEGGEKLKGLTEAAAFLNVHKARVFEWSRKGKMECIQLPTGECKFSTSQLKRYQRRNAKR